jgi:hypothetical protein
MKEVIRAEIQVCDALQPSHHRICQSQPQITQMWKNLSAFAPSGRLVLTMLWKGET